ncbi:MAG: PTS sugar transporter subunit IIA [Verrucomicrobia bacterium]|nr:PTS sugar transporter subunit IIA [Verrucomicrobiota bacterium]
MKFSEIISPSQIVLDLKATDRWVAIEELVNCLVTQKCIVETRRDSVIHAVKTREKTMSTGIGFGIAIPHASTDAIEKVTAVLARSSTGINFDSLDNQPVKLVVLFLVPTGQYQQHLKTLASISRFLNDRDFREQAEQAKTADDLYQLILKRES